MGARERAVAHAVPPLEHSRRLGEQSFADALGVAPSFRDLHEVAYQMSPAELMFGARPPVVGAVAVAHQHAARTAKDCVRSLGGAPPMDHEDGDGRRHYGPQPGLAACLAPAGLVGVLHRLLDDERPRLFERRRESCARDALTTDDGPQRDAETEDVAHQLGHGALAQAVDAHQRGRHRHDTRPERARRHAGGQRGRRANAARAVERVQHVLLDDGLDARQLEHLMTARRRVVARERRAARTATLRPELHALVDLVGRDERALVLVVSLLRAGLATRRHLRARWRRTGTITRWRLRGIARGATRLLLELRHSRQQRLDLRCQLRDHCRLRGNGRRLLGNTVVSPIARHDSLNACAARVMESGFFTPSERSISHSAAWNTWTHP